MLATGPGALHLEAEAGERSESQANLVSKPSSATSSVHEAEQGAVLICLKGVL